MKRIKMSWIGSVLLAAAFAYSLWTQAVRTRETVDPDIINISFAHTQLDPSLLEAYDTAIAQYEALNPGVRVHQIPIPERVWRFWMESRLAGGMAPDLMQLLSNDPNPIEQNFSPIDAWVNRPNPYNEGTELEGMPWLNTFTIAMDGPPAFWPSFQSYYAMPLTIYTFRLYYNVDLLEEITGSTEFSQDFQEFLTLCDQVVAYADEQVRVLYPLAGSRFNSPEIVEKLVQSQTTTLLDRVDAMRDSAGEKKADMRSGYLRGQWDFETSEVRSALRLVSRFGKYFQPGFLFANREDAMFYFMQNRALMIVAGSFEVEGIRQQATFDIGLSHLPLPTPDDPEYGQFADDLPNERAASPRSAFALTKQSKHKDQAMDFLMFLTSKKAYPQFIEISGWVPVLRDVDVREANQVFFPRMEGPAEAMPIGGGVETERLWDITASLLFEDEGIERFIERVKPVWAEHVVMDIRKEIRESLNMSASLDPEMGFSILNEFESPYGDLEGKQISRIQMNQIIQEVYRYSKEYLIWRYETEGIPSDPVPANYGRPADRTAGIPQPDNQ